jgi:predicted ester cyclase
LAWEFFGLSHHATRDSARHAECAIKVQHRNPKSEARYAEAALARNFFDRTLPPGRPQGVNGVLEASKNFRAAIPDLRAEIEELLVVNDRAVVRYTFMGHFTGTFKDAKGDGREISFRAVDIYRVQNGQISDNWHLEDNLSLTQQLGVVKP